MNIQEAVKKAMESNACITLPEVSTEVKIKPTNGIGNCILMGADGSNPSKRGWQPSAEQLIRDDWMIVS